MDEHLAAFAAIAEHSVEYQGHGWGCAWREDGQWRSHHSIEPVWKDPCRPAGRTNLLLAHARSAFRDEGICVDNNMPFRQGDRFFAFNGELLGVRIREKGRIGAEKIFNFVQRFDTGDLRVALKRGLAAIEKRTRHVRAMNVIVAEPLQVCVASRFNESPEYFQMQRCTVGDMQIVCSERYPPPFLQEAQWTPVPNGEVGGWTVADGMPRVADGPAARKLVID